jgi:hypothetical protein
MPLGPLYAVAVVAEFTLSMHALLCEISPIADACLMLELSVSGEEVSMLGGSVGGCDVAGARRRTVTGRRCRR